MERIYHITSSDEAMAAGRAGVYVPAGFEIEGFIHCSYADQVCAVAHSRFRGRQDLVLLEIDPALLGCDVIEENLEGGVALFPHIYGKLPMAALVRIYEFPCGADGRFQLPRCIGVSSPASASSESM